MTLPMPEPSAIAPDQARLRDSLEAYLEWIDIVAAERIQRIDKALEEAEFDLGQLSQEAEAAQKGLVAAQVKAIKDL